jgi:hypothetical protein
MTEDNLVPSPLLIKQWRDEWFEGDRVEHSEYSHVARQAAQWGADRELEACCDWLHWQNLATHQDLIPSLRAGRRPKVPRLKERALEAMHRNWNPHNNDDFATIARALEALPND